MAIVIPDSIFTIYNDAVTLFERSSILFFPETRTECTNCYLNTMGYGGQSMSYYRAGGPEPFETGMPCPFCGGAGYKSIEETLEIAMRIYWDKKLFIKAGPAIDFPHGAIQTITKMIYMPKIELANYMIPKYDGVEEYKPAKFYKIGPSYPQGFKQNPVKYIVTYWSQNPGA